MPDLTTNFAGIRSPNPFWLASGPPTNCGEQIMRAFDKGWGGAVWKTIGDPILNVSSRYSSVDWNGQRMMGLNNIELISDRPIDVNLREIAEVKKRYPKHAVIASLMVESTRDAWHDIVKRTEEAGADGLELNFGCPHGMSERGMGAAVGQVPEYSCMITEWVKEVARTPVMVKLTPNITDIRAVARAARRGGADGLSAINTINSITGMTWTAIHRSYVVRTVLLDIKEQTLEALHLTARKLALALKVVGLVNLQFAIQRDQQGNDSVGVNAVKVPPPRGRCRTCPRRQAFHWPRSQRQLMTGRKLRELLPEQLASGKGPGTGAGATP